MPFGGVCVIVYKCRLLLATEQKKHRRNADAFSVWNYSNLFH